MIPVKLQREPPQFDKNVRQKGNSWIANVYNPATEKPKPSQYPAYWQKCTKELWKAYSGICAYYAVYFEITAGASSTDHLVAKSKNIALAYEWNNYRLSCLGANRNKGKFDDILDPVGMVQNTFLLNLASGEIRHNSGLSLPILELAKKTIARLKLDSLEMNDMRQRLYTMYLKNKDEDFLKFYSPFVWYEAQRQGLL